MPSPRLRTTLPAMVVLLVLMPRSAHAQAPGDCSNWTPWDPIQPLNVAWSWRMCPTISQRYDVQWRFSNNGPDDIEFRYQLFTGSVSECGERNRGRVFASGKLKLNGAERHYNYSGRKTIRQTGFQRDFVLYLCLLEVVESGG